MPYSYGCGKHGGHVVFINSLQPTVANSKRLCPEAQPPPRDASRDDDQRAFPNRRSQIECIFKAPYSHAYEMGYGELARTEEMQVVEFALPKNRIQ